MKPRKGWLLTREFGGVEATRLAVILTTKKMTNSAVDDVVKEAHLKEYGRLWPNTAVWDLSGPTDLLLKTPICDYRLTPIEVYG